MVGRSPETVGRERSIGAAAGTVAGPVGAGAAASSISSSALIARVPQRSRPSSQRTLRRADLRGSPLRGGTTRAGASARAIGARAAAVLAERDVAREGEGSPPSGQETRGGTHPACMTPATTQLPGGMTVPLLYGWEYILAGVLLAVAIGVGALVALAAGRARSRRSDWQAWLDSRSGGHRVED